MRFDLSEVTGVIKDRRTIYPEQFSDRVVQKEMVENILGAAIWAPTHGRTQPWRFKVFTGEAKNRLKDTFQALYKQHNPEESFKEIKYKRIGDRIDRTSTLVLLVMKRTTDSPIPEIEEVEAVACAAQNILLMSTAYGLGSYWSSPGFIYKEGVNEEFGLEKQDKILGLIYLGYPAGEWPKGHRKPLEYVTEWVK